MPARLWMALLPAALLAASAPAPKENVILRAMQDEMNRSRPLRVLGLDPPYYLEYAVDDAVSFTASATLGGLLSVRQSPFRIPRVQVRIGAPEFDNTNFVLSDIVRGSRYDAEQLPLDDDYLAVRRSFWLLTDRTYKSALEALSAKRSALKNVTLSEQLADFAPAEPVKLDLPGGPREVNAAEWSGRVKALSRIFLSYPRVQTSMVDFAATQTCYLFVNTDGASVRLPDALFYLRVRANTQASDGMPLRDSTVLHSRELERLPAEAQLREAIDQVARNLTALVAAPRGENYSGPVLIEGLASAQIFAEVLGGNLAVPRRPVSMPGRPVAMLASELEGRAGSRILPEWMDVIDDPTLTEWQGRRLIGHYRVDLEGVAPKPLTLVEQGVLKTFLLTRQPIRGFSGSNGRARLPGSFGAKSAASSNLLIRTGKSVPLEALRKQFLDLVRQRNKPYGIVVRKMDFPSTSSFEEVRRLTSAAFQAGGSRPVSSPVLVYRVYPDGKEELVRGLRFKSFSARSLKDILAASQEMTAFDFLENKAPFALMGAGNFVAECSVVAPSVLVDDLDLEDWRDQMPTLPLAPAPLLVQAP